MPEEHHSYEKAGTSEEQFITAKEEAKKITPASFKCMYQFATTTDIVILILGLLSALIFSLSPVALVICIGESIDNLEESNSDDKDDLYHNMRKLAIENYALAFISMFSC